MSGAVDKPAEVPHRIPITSIAAYFLRLGSLGFGGPAALCGQMEKELVGEKGWVTKDKMREAIAISHTNGPNFRPVPSVGIRST
jgi:chromate transport protein ChrA